MNHPGTPRPTANSGHRTRAPRTRLASVALVVASALVILALLGMGYDGEVVVEALGLGFSFDALPQSLLEAIAGHEACVEEAGGLDSGRSLDRCLHHIVIAGAPVPRPTWTSPCRATR